MTLPRRSSPRIVSARVRLGWTSRSNERFFRGFTPTASSISSPARCYVADVESALYDAVKPGGYLVVHYHNRLAQAHYSNIADAPYEYLDEDSAWAPETFADRFELVITGESLLSYDCIHDVLGTWPRSVFSETGSTGRYGAHRYEPLVYVPKSDA